MAFTGCSSIETIEIDSNKLSIKFPYQLVDVLKKKGMECSNIEFSRDDIDNWARSHPKDLSNKGYDCEQYQKTHPNDCDSKGKLVRITIPDTVTKIGSNCFNHYVNLGSIRLPTSLTEFGKKCFCGCERLHNHYKNFPDHCW
ncbi:hypothetical protein QTN25_010110 [Entamoeba marina]